MALRVRFRPYSEVTVCILQSFVIHTAERVMNYDHIKLKLHCYMLCYVPG
jgi:hypothetical protein